MKRFFSFASLISILPLLLACEIGNPGHLEGEYAGRDGAGESTQNVTAVMAATGDGFVTGIWRSPGLVEEGELSGKLGFFENELILTSVKGRCLGEFRGSFAVKGDVLTGTLANNPACPAQTFNFELKKKN